MQRTRREILNILKLRGQATLEDLAREVDLVPVTVRTHLSVLEREGLIVVDEQRGKIGRPHYVYSLTPKADQLFPQAYAAFANRILGCLSEITNPDQFGCLARTLAECWARERLDRLAGKCLEERVVETATIRTEEGTLATWERDEDGFRLVQHHCPCRLLAEHHRLVCQTEQEYLQILLDADVERIEHQMDGGRTCTYRIRPPVPSPVQEAEEPLA